MTIAPATLKWLEKKDAIFRNIVVAHGVPKRRTYPQSFQTLAQLILEQFVSLSSAKATFARLKTAVGKTFTPSAVLALPEEEMRACGVSRQKTRYLRALAQEIGSGSLSLRALAKLPDDEVREKLMQVTGIGRWTADVYLMTVLKRDDVFPLGDVAAVNSVKALWKLETKEEISRLTDSWAPHRTASTLLIWHWYLSRADAGKKPTKHQ